MSENEFSFPTEILGYPVVVVDQETLDATARENIEISRREQEEEEESV